MVLNSCDYVEKVEHQINRSSFSRLDEDSSPEIKEKVSNWLDKRPEKITEERKKLSKMYLLREQLWKYLI